MSGEPEAVIASYGWCPSRTTWHRQVDGYYKCECCSTRRRYDQLEDPWPVDRGGSGE